LEIILNNLKNELIFTIDGCMVQKTPQIEIAKIYVQIFNHTVLILLRDFWKDNHQNLSVMKNKIYLKKNFSPKKLLTFPVKLHNTIPK